MLQGEGSQCANGHALEAEPSVPLPPARHSPDFASVHWYGAEYTFTPTQRAIVRQLWEAWEDGTPDVSQETLTEAAGSERGRMRDLFRDHNAWQVVIVSRSKGTFRLNAPEGGRALTPFPVNGQPAERAPSCDERCAEAILLPLLAKLAAEGEPMEALYQRDGWRARLVVEAVSEPVLPGARPIKGAEGDILALLHREGRRFTQTEFFTTFGPGKAPEWSESTLAKALADMTNRRLVLTNRRDSYGAGYGLPEWDDAQPPPMKPVERDILALVTHENRRLMLADLFSAFGPGKKPEYGESTISHAVAEMTKRRNLLTNRNDSYGKGYGLPEWEDSPPLRPVEQDILALIRREMRRLVTPEIFSAFGPGREPEWSESTLSHALGDLASDRRKLLSNRKDGRGKGYGLLEWDGDAPPPPTDSAALASRVAPLHTRIISPLACYCADHEPTESECGLCAAGRNPPGVVYCQRAASGEGIHAGGWLLSGDAALLKRVAEKLR